MTTPETVPPNRPQPRPQSPLSKWQRNAAIYEAATEQGLTYADIARRHGITRERVRQIVLAEENRRGEQKRCAESRPPAGRESVLENELRIMADLARPGASYAAVAREHGIKEATVRLIADNAVKEALDEGIEPPTTPPAP